MWVHYNGHKIWYPVDHRRTKWTLIQINSQKCWDLVLDCNLAPKGGINVCLIYKPYISSVDPHICQLQSQWLMGGALFERIQNTKLWGQALGWYKNNTQLGSSHQEICFVLLFAQNTTSCVLLVRTPTVTSFHFWLGGHSYDTSCRILQKLLRVAIHCGLCKNSLCRTFSLSH